MAKKKEEKPAFMPVTRREAFLLAIAEGDPKIAPEPMTREEKLLRMIAERAGLLK